jgi:hypothetical protein
MSILQHDFDKPNENNDQPREYRAKLTHCRKGGVELAVFVPLKYPDKDSVPPCDLPRKELTEEERAERDLANARRAAQRARQGLRHVLKTMDAKYLWTFSWREDMQDLAHAQKVYARFRRLLADKYPEAKFVTVPERHHQNRTGFHLHTAVADRLDVHWVRRCWWLALGHRVQVTYETVSGRTKQKLIPYIKENEVWREALPSEVLGNVDVVGRKKRFGKPDPLWTSDRLATYLAKYMDKTFTEAQESARRYWPSKGCERPTVEKFWLMATNVDEALKEAFAIVKELHGMSTTQIFLSQDYLNIWIVGYATEPPF